MPFTLAVVRWSLRRKKRRVRRDLKRLRRIQRQQPPPPPPSPPPEPWDDGLLICVQLVNYEDLENVHFMRFNIPSKTLNNLLSKVELERSEAITRYVPHSHGAHEDPERFFAYSPVAVSNGPFLFPLNPCCASCAIDSEVFCLGGECCTSDKDDGLCHAIYACDFAKYPNGTSLPYFLITVISLQWCLWVKNSIFSKRDIVPVALVHDVHGEQPSTRLPFCTFDKSAILDLAVASLGNKLLIVDRILRLLYYCHIQDFKWTPLNIKKFEPLLNPLSMMRGKPVTVAQYNTLCWIDEEDYIGAFNWENMSVSVGPIIGFAREVPPRYASRPQRSLVHLKDELFGLIWVDSSSRLHITVLFICLEAARDALSDSPHLLTVSVVACFCYHLDFDSSVQAAYLLSSKPFN
ncbi:hypothetical protein RND81_02G175100 [Saponaria officinalis]|uniref:DUF1618 domain-containing protein n=1 Tax=Saponaria officinalis TaxID=3572 RepID=A0AAW1MNA8_SAPOF